MNRQRNIEDISEADYVVVSSTPSTSLAGSQSRIIYDSIVGATDKLFPNRKGQVFTVAITASGLAKSNIDLNQYYMRNADVIDGYFNRIDYDALGDAIGGAIDQGMREKIPAFVAGAIIGVGIKTLLRIVL